MITTIILLIEKTNNNNCPRVAVDGVFELHSKK